MSLQTRPLLISAGAGTVALLVSSLLNRQITHLALPSSTITPPWSGGILVCCFSIFFNLAIYIGIGLLYIYLVSRDAPSSAEAGMIGGGVAALLASLVAGGVNLIYSVLINANVINQATQSFTDIPPDLAPSIGLTLTAAYFGSAIGLCFSAVVAMLFGALGGALSGAVLSSRQREIV
jgi:hypothetical protein